MAGYDRLTPEGRRFFNEIEELKKLETRVGFTEGKKGFGQNHESVNADDYDEGPTITDVAMWNELGTANSPPRPFLRPSVDNNAGRINAMCKAQLQAISRGEKTAEEALRAIGALQVGLIQNEIRNGDFEPNAPSTIKKKKSDKPLIDSAHMRQSVHYIIKPKGG